MTVINLINTVSVLVIVTINAGVKRIHPSKSIPFYAAYTTYGVKNSAATAPLASGVLVIGQSSYYVTSGFATEPNEINAAFDSVAYWYLSYPVQSALTRKTLFGDCNVNDAGEFIDGISPSIPTYDQFIASSRTFR